MSIEGPGAEMKGTADVHHALPWRTAAVLCVLAIVIFGMLAGRYYLAPGDSSQTRATSVAADGPTETASAEADGVSSPCGSCDARHRHILRLREADP